MTSPNVSPPALLVGLSGPSSSGKTTIARHLAQIFPRTVLLHADDYYKPVHELPMRAGMQNWDAAASIDLPRLLDALNDAGIASAGTNTQEVNTKDQEATTKDQDTNSSSTAGLNAGSTASSSMQTPATQPVGEAGSSSASDRPSPKLPESSEKSSDMDRRDMSFGASDACIARLRALVTQTLDSTSSSTSVSSMDSNTVSVDCNTVSVDRKTASMDRTTVSMGRKTVRTIVILDGFLLYDHLLDPLPSLLDPKFLLRAMRTATISRRAARSAYILADGETWEDPPGYVEQVVWPEYVEAHARLFEDGDVEGVVCQKMAELEGIEVLDKCLEGKDGIEWALQIIVDRLLQVLQQNHS